MVNGRDIDADGGDIGVCLSVAGDIGKVITAAIPGIRRIGQGGYGAGKRAVNGRRDNTESQVIIICIRG